MTSRQRYIKRRAERLARRGIKLYRVDGVYRKDAPDDDEPKNNSAGQSGGHGNTKIPFGLCKREGIEIGQDWTPKDAWNALEGEGYSAGEVYKELKQSGKVPQKSKVDVKEDRDFIERYKKRGELESRAEDLKQKTRGAKRRVEDCTFELETAEKRKSLLGRKLEEADEFEREELQDRYDRTVEQIESLKSDREKAQKEYDTGKNEEESVRRQLEEVSGENGERKYQESVDRILNNSPYAKKVLEYRGIQESAEEARINLTKAKEEADEAKGALDLVTRIMNRAFEEGDTKNGEYYRDVVLPQRKKQAEDSKKHAELCQRTADDLENRLKSVKGTADEKEWGQVYELSVDRDTVKDGPYKDRDIQYYAKRLGEVEKVKYINPVKRINSISEEDIIKTLGGGDETSGSCVSLSFAYAANKAGYGVLDFRGGKSRHFFAYEWHTIAQRLGADSRKSFNNISDSNELLQKTVEGKEYILMTGNHAAVVRRKGGSYEFLELQSHTSNGWKELNDNVLKERFKARKRRKYQSDTSLIDLDRLKESKDFLMITGYINTERDKQKKGESGSEK